MYGRPSCALCQVTAENLQLRSAGMGSEPARQPPSSCRASHSPLSPPCMCTMTVINKCHQNGLCGGRASHACFPWLQSACSLCFLSSHYAVPSPTPLCPCKALWELGFVYSANLGMDGQRSLFVLFLPSNPFGSESSCSWTWLSYQVRCGSVSG